MKNRIRAGIIGGAGYTGGEIVRLLLNHPDVDIAFVHSRSNAGVLVSTIHHDLVGETNIVFSSDLTVGVDVVFLCVGHGEAKTLLTHYDFGQARIIDLSQDFRLLSDFKVDNRQFVYGLPELNKEQIKNADAIANPGCFATALQLALLPLASGGLLSETHATGITGSTGAGQKLQNSSHFSWRANNIEAYKALAHQHIHEVMQTLQAQQPTARRLNFIPWRGDFTRGIYVSVYTSCSLPIEELNELYVSFYADAPFTIVSPNMINLKQVVNTNKCLLHLEKVDDKVVVHAALDNLLKGASGQAVQNMNLMFGFPEYSGLKLKASSF
jgi:N-acetyl-gamma-glutamyl-phosphate reductase